MELRSSILCLKNKNFENCISGNLKFATKRPAANTPTVESFLEAGTHCIFPFLENLDVHRSFIFLA
jgi:hypothetical protein